MKAYKLEVLIIDFENQGINEVTQEIQNMRYAHAKVVSHREADIGQWHDDHPLNKTPTANAEYERLFP